MARRSGSIRAPIVLSSVSVALSIALLVGWTLLIARSPDFSSALFANVSLLVGGIVSIITIITVLVLFSIFLVGEIREVRRQYSFIDSVTHELKSPLASLKLCLETLQRRELQEEQKAQLRGMALKDVDRLNVFIDDILEASRLDHGRRSYTLETVQLAPLIARSIDVITARHHLPAGWITCHVPADLAVQSDTTVLDTVMKNLLDNAVKYSPTTLAVTLSAAVTSEHVEIEVRDQGIGIAKAQLRRIFERFYRVPREEVYMRQGSGLGLYVVASLVRELGGKLEARSGGEGQGTAIILWLPK